MKKLISLVSGFLSFSPKAFALEGKHNSEATKVGTFKTVKVSEFGNNLFSQVYDFFSALYSSFLKGFVSLRDFIDLGDWFVDLWSQPDKKEMLLSFAFHVVAAFILAMVATKLMSFWVNPKRFQLLLCKAYPTATKQRRVVYAVLLSTLPPLVFGFVFYSVFRLINPWNAIYVEIVRISTSGIVSIWILLAVGRIFLKPKTSDHKHIPLSQEALTTTYYWLRRMAVVALFGFFTIETGRLIGLPLVGYKLLWQGTGFIIALMAIFMMVSLRVEMKGWIQEQKKNPKTTRLRQAMLPYLEYSYIPVIFFIAISYISWVTYERDQFQIVLWKFLVTLALFPILRYAVHCLRKVRILYIQRNLKQFSFLTTNRAIFYGRQIDFVTITIFYAFSLLLVLNMWGLNPSYFIFSSFGRLIAEKVSSIFFIIVGSIFLVRAGNGLLARYLHVTPNEDDAEGKHHVARLRTIHSVSGNILRIIVWVPAILLIIVELDIDVMPLLATVGVLSVGISFGIQSLVKDFVTGFFMLLEDSFSVGDLATINGQQGYIKSLTIRVVRLRASDGSLFTYPYGSITTLSNQTKDYSAAVLPFQVGIEADLKKVYQMLDDIFKDLKQDSQVQSLIIAPLTISGVTEVNDHALEVRVVIRTKPSESFKVKCAFNSLLKQYISSYKIPLAVPKILNLNYVVEK